MKYPFDSILVFIFRIFIGIIFCISGSIKLFTYWEFVQTVYEFKIIPEIFVTEFAFILPIIEYILGVLLILGLFIKKACAALIFLLFLFIIAIAINLWRENLIECGCFGFMMREYIGWKLLFRDFLLITILGYMMTKSAYILTIDNYLKKK